MCQWPGIELETVDSVEAFEVLGLDKLSPEWISELQILLDALSKLKG